MKKKLLGQERLKKLFYSLSFILLFTTFGWGQSAVFTTPTTNGTWLCPAGVTSVTVKCWGAGGAGGAATNVANRVGGGGGGGSYVTNTITVVPGTTYNITVGAGGTPNSNTSSGSYGRPGGKSEFSGGVVTPITASGGTGGSGGVPNQTFGIGGVLGGIYAYSHSGTATVQYTTAVTVPAPVGGGTTATAIGQLSGLGLNSVNPTSMGSGYTAADGIISLTLTGGTGQTVTTILYNPDIDAGGTATKGANGNAGVTGTNGGAGGAGGNGGAGAPANTTGGTVGTVGTAPGGGGAGGFANSATARQGGVGGAGKVELTWISSIPTIVLNKTTLSGFNYDAGNGPSASQNFTVSGVSLTDGVILTPPTNFEISTDNSSWTSNPSSITLSQTGGSLDGSPVTIYARLKAGLPAGNYNSEDISLTSTGATPVSVTCSGGVTGIFYYSGFGALATTTNWGTATDGSGANPTNFTDNYQRFIIRNTTAVTTDAAWAVSGTNSKIIVGDATQAGITLTIAPTFPITGIMDITAASSGANSIIVQDNTQPTFGLLDDNSEVHYQIGVSITGAYTYGKLFIEGTGTANISSAPVVKTAMTVAAGKTLSMFPNSLFYVTINPGGTVQIDGTVIVQKAEGLVDTVVSSSSSKGSFQFLGTDNLTLGANSVINYGRNTTTNQTITPRNYVNLTVSGTTATKNMTAATSVSGILSLPTTGAATILNTNGFLTLKSTSATSTAVISQIGNISSVINGNVTVERYIPAGQRAYRFLSSPVSTTTFIDTNWQAGTHITGAGGATNGFDATTGNNPSMFTYNNTTPAWNAVTNTNATVLTSGVPYLTYIRGSRAASLAIAPIGSIPSDAATLSATGTLTTGNVLVSGLNETADGFSAVGNPYQAQVDMEAVLAAGTNLNSGFYYVVDPSLGTKGAYLTVDVTAAASAHISKYLQPGQACFVKTLAAGPASLTFTEANKSEAAAQTTIFKTKNNAMPSIGLTLYDSASNRLDILKIAFDASETNDVNQNDASKMNNFDESMASSNNGKLLAIEKRAMPTDSDEIPLSITKYRGTSYTIKAEGTGLTGSTPYLLDQFANKTIEIPQDGSVNYAYTVDAAIPASIAADRFRLIYAKTLKTIDNAVASFALYPNPSKTNSFSVAIPQSLTKASLTVSNMLGQKLYSQNDLQSGTTVNVTASNVKTAGVYLVSLTSEGKTTTTKWIVE